MSGYSVKWFSFPFKLKKILPSPTVVFRNFFQNKRVAKSLTVSLRYQVPGAATSTSSSRACALVRYDSEKISNDAFALLKQFNSSPGHSPQWLDIIFMLYKFKKYWKYNKRNIHYFIDLVIHKMRIFTISSVKYISDVSVNLFVTPLCCLCTGW